MAYKDYEDELTSLIDRLKKLCVKHDLPMVTSVQVDNDREQARLNQVSDIVGAFHIVGTFHPVKDHENMYPPIYDAIHELFYGDKEAGYTDPVEVDKTDLEMN